MATSDIQLCSLCKEVDDNNEAVTWCTECETFLCLDCDKHHLRNKSSKQHKTLPSNDYKKLPDWIKTGNRCPDHDQRYEVYCPNHSDACCSQCFTEKHKNCKDLKHLPDILKDVTSSASMSHLEKDLSNVVENYELVVTYLRTRLSKINTQKTKGIENIQHIRKSLNEHLDKLEQGMIKELDEQHTKLKAETEKLLNQIKTKHSQIKQLQEDNEKIKKYATELQTFIGLKEIARMTTEEIRYLEEIVQSGDLDEPKLELHMSSNVKSALTKLTSFGSVSVIFDPRSLELKKKVECQVAIPVSTMKRITEINPVFKRKITLPEKNMKYDISCCEILPNGHLLFVDYTGNQLIHCNNEGVYINKINNFSASPHSVCFLEDNTVAVTLSESHQILKVDLVSEETITTIERRNITHCYGIDSNGKIIVVVERTEIREHITVLDLEGKEITCLLMDGDGWEFVAVFDNLVYCSKWSRNTVLCMQDTGEKLWKIDVEDLQEPLGITIGNNHFIYVACENNDSICVISPDGLTSRILLSKRDGIKKPKDVSIDRKRQTLLVSNWNDGCAYMYQI